jgi:adenine-specific DNA-methyltransferase
MKSTSHISGSVQTLGAWLRQLRQARRLPLRSVAAVAQMDSTLLSKIELAQRLPTEEQTRTIAKFFKVPFDEMEAKRLAEKFRMHYGNSPAARKAARLINEQSAEYKKLGNSPREIALTQPDASLMSSDNILREIDAFRQPATESLDPVFRRERGQFLTPLSVASFMASLLAKPRKELHLLDAGAGTGILSTAAILGQLARNNPPQRITVTGFEIEPALTGYLQKSYAYCAEECRQKKVEFSFRIIAEDFISYASDVLRADMFAPARHKFNVAIVNPPYAKIKNDSLTRRRLRSVGIETSNLYAAFLALLAQLLDEGGELVAITPRSFCNGPYFKPFRVQFLGAMSLRQIHVFNSRSEAFKDDDVLQENVITYAEKTQMCSNRIVISTSDGTSCVEIRKRSCPYEDVVSPKDEDQVIHLATDQIQNEYRKQIARFSNRLSDMELSVSTGRVVDFRARDFLRIDPGPDTVPLIYPCHFKSGFVSWPKVNGRKPNAILNNAQTKSLLLASDVYVLVKRFTSKEEKRRVVACIYDPSRVSSNLVGFENHLDYFHIHGKGLPMDFAKGLAAFLNSTMVDAYFRQFNGHTQVNASDLKRIRFPSRMELEKLGRKIGDRSSDQVALDELIRKELL